MLILNGNPAAITTIIAEPVFWSCASEIARFSKKNTNNFASNVRIKGKKPIKKQTENKHKIKAYPNS